MIRAATEQDFARATKAESELRVCALKYAYGLNVPFIQYFADDNGNIASLMDGVLSLHCNDELSDEWILFIRMLPSVTTIHTDKKTALKLSQQLPCTLKTGQVHMLKSMSSESPLQSETVDFNGFLRIFELLSNAFGIKSSFDAWYVDVSHRMRHCCCHVTTQTMDDRFVSVAMTVAETEDAALIGGVVTAEEYRGKGLASRCIERLIRTLPQKTILISPDTDAAARLYERIGFKACGTWAELTLI